MTKTLRKTNVYSIVATVACLLYLCGSTTVTVQAQWTTPNTSQNINNTNSGNVGVGTSSPGFKLDVMSSINLIARFDSSAAVHTQVLINAPSGFNANLALQHGGVSKWYMGNRASNDRLSFIESTGNIEVLTVLQNGKVGAGTITPTAQFHIMTAAGDGEGLRIHRNANTSGWGVAQFFTLNNSSGAATDYSQISGGITSNTAGAESGLLAFYTRNSGALAERMRISHAGQVGIGTASPVYSLDVNGGVNSFRAKAAASSADDTIATFENNSAIQMIVRANGNVGIGTTSPANKLHVNGSITIENGNINAKYQDLAEWVDSSQALPAGTVVIIDPTKHNQVIASTQPYDSRVAGVISVQPGIALGERSEGRVLVATTGRVKVKVDATNGPIQMGDLLVTSDRPGYAMKSTPVDVGGIRMHRPGTLIGKALEPLAQGVGEILILLSMQ